MPTRLDENTVLTDDGQKIYLPLPPDATPGADPGGLNAAPLPTAPGLPSSPGGFGGPGPTQAEKDLETSVNSDLSSLPPGPDELPPPVSKRGQTPPNRPGVEGFDPVAYAAAGGQVKTDADYVKSLGGLGQDQERAAVKKNDYEDTLRTLHAEAEKRLADETVAVATEYQDKVDRIQKDAQARWKAWNDRMTETSQTLVDPHRAFKNMGTLSKGLWILSFMAGGAIGDNSTQQALDKVVSEDIGAQKFNVETKMGGLKEEEQALAKMDAGDTSALERWYFQRNLRYQAFGKALDAQIATMTAPAAKAAGLLAAKAVIDKAMFDGQEKVKNAVEERAKAATAHMYSQADIRLTAALRNVTDAKKEGMATAKLNYETAIPTTAIGVKVMEGGRPVNAELHARTSQDATKATELITAASQEATELGYIRRELPKMSQADLMRGGSPEYRAHVQALLAAKIKQTSGLASSDQEAARIAISEFGASMMPRPGLLDSITSVGDLRQGVIDTVDADLRNLPEKTMKSVRGYLRAEDADRFHLDFTPEDQRDEKPNPEEEPYADKQKRASLGVVTPPSDLRPPKTAIEARVAEMQGPFAAETYAKEKADNKLPKLPVEDEKVLWQAEADFQKMPADQVMGLMGAYLKRPGLSTEAQHEIRMEALLAAAEARVKEDDLKAGAEAVTLMRNPLAGMDTKSKAAALADYYKSPEYQQALKEAGLLPAR